MSRTMAVGSVLALLTAASPANACTCCFYAINDGANIAEHGITIGHLTSLGPVLDGLGDRLVGWNISQGAAFKATWASAVGQAVSKISSLKPSTPLAGSASTAPQMRDNFSKEVLPGSSASSPPAAPAAAQLRIAALDGQALALAVRSAAAMSPAAVTAAAGANDPAVEDRSAALARLGAAIMAASAELTSVVAVESAITEIRALRALQ